MHFGNGILNSSEITVRADTLFSALFIEALKSGKAEKLYNAVTTGSLRISDAFPYDHDEYYIPKPVIRIEAGDTGNSLEKKFYKGLKYLPVQKLSDYLSGKMDMEDRVKTFAGVSTRTMANVRREEDSLPYQVGVCSFEEGTGLYVLTKTENEDEMNLFDDLIRALSVVGIGGKRSAGLGKFSVNIREVEPAFLKCFDTEKGIKMLLSVALPKEEEMTAAMDGASFNVIQRAGFVASEMYSYDQKKHTLYAFESGSCFNNTFEGDIYNVSRGSGHPVYRYARPFFMSITGE